MTRREFLLALMAAGAAPAIVARASRLTPETGPVTCACGHPLTLVHAFDLKCPEFGPIMRDLADGIAADLNRPNALVELLRT